MDTHGGGSPLPVAALSLHAFAPNSVCVKHSARPSKAAGPSPVIGARDGVRSYPIDAKLATDVPAAAAGEPRTQRQPNALTRLIVAIPGALSRMVNSPPSRVSFTGPARLSDMRVFPSVVPKRASPGGGALPAGGAARKPAVVWFRNDLRLHDNPSLDRACREGTSVLPVYVFDPRDYGKAPNGFARTGSARAQFILDAVSDLRTRLRAAGSDLLVRVGRPEDVVSELAASVGAGAVYCQAEVTEEEAAVEGRVRATLERDGCELRTQWGGTLYHVEDLPFKLSAMPTSYADFRARVAGLSVRPLVASERGIKGLPQGVSLEAGELPSLQRLGVSAPRPAAAAGATAAGGFGAAPVSLSLAAATQGLKGGETEALKHLKAFMDELKSAMSKQQQQPRQGRGAAAATAGAPTASGPGSRSDSFSCRISPWLALGCLSPRRMYLEMKQHLPQQQSLQPQPQQPQQRAGDAAAAPAATAGPANWLVFELLWRDFFRFVSQKYAAKPRKAPTAAGAAAAAAAVPRVVVRSATASAAVPAAPALALAAA